MLRLSYLIAICSLALTINSANANTIMFDVSGAYTVPSAGTFSGTINVTANGGNYAVTAFDINFPSFADFTNVPVPPYGFIGPGTGNGGIFVITGSYNLSLYFADPLFMNGIGLLTTSTTIFGGELFSCSSPDCAMGIQSVA